MVASNELLGVCKRLAFVDALTPVHVHDLLMEFFICKNTKFEDIFSQFARSKDLGNIDSLLTIRKSEPPKIQIDKILEKAVNTYVQHVLQDE